MGSATGRDLHVDVLLTDIAMNYRPQGMIADQLAPIIPVAKETNSYPIYSQAEIYAIENTNRSRGVEANRITRSVSSAQYSAKNYALAYDIPVEDRANMDAAFQFQMDTGAVQYLTTKLYLDWDKRALAAAVAGVGTSFLCGSSWNITGATAGDPVSQIWKGMEQVENATGYKPNSIAFGWQAWNWCRRNYNFRNFVLGLNNGGGAVTRQGAAAAFELERLLVAGGFYNSKNEAQAVSFSNYFAGDQILLYYAPMQASITDPSFMYSFRWTAPELGAPFAALRHEFDSRKRLDGVEVQYYQDERVTGSLFSALITGVGSAQATGLT